MTDESRANWLKAAGTLLCCYVGGMGMLWCVCKMMGWL